MTKQHNTGRSPLSAVGDDGANVLIQLAGVIDTSNIDTVVGALRECAAAERDVVIDLREVRALDAGVARWVEALDHRLHDRGHSVVVSGASTEADNVLRRCGLEHLYSQDFTLDLREPLATDADHPLR